MFKLKDVLYTVVTSNVIVYIELRYNVRILALSELGVSQMYFTLDEFNACAEIVQLTQEH